MLDILTIAGEDIDLYLEKKKAHLKTIESNVQKARKESNFLKTKLMVAFYSFNLYQLIFPVPVREDRECEYET